MAYNGGFPMNYQPMGYLYPQQYQAASAANTGAQAPSSSGIIWVQGEAGAKSYLVAPNNTVQLWDSENQVIYLKSADASGMPSMKILDYKIRDAQPTAQPQVVANQDFVTRTELDAFENKINTKLDEFFRKEVEQDGKSAV